MRSAPSWSLHHPWLLGLGMYAAPSSSAAGYAPAACVRASACQTNHGIMNLGPGERSVLPSFGLSERFLDLLIWTGPFLASPEPTERCCTNVVAMSCFPFFFFATFAQSHTTRHISI